MDHRPQQPAGTERTGKGMMFVAAILALGVLTLFFDMVQDRQRNPNREVHSQVSDGGFREVVLQRNAGGHYVTSGYINGEPVQFMLDTGASDVSIPEGVAQRLGLRRGPEQDYQTANGIITGYLTRVDEVRVGDIAIGNVLASINPHVDDDEILLGMSFLKHLEFTQRGDTLILRQ